MVETIDAGDKRVSRRAVVNAPAGAIFEVVINPHQHYKLDGSGTVGENISGPTRLTTGDAFSTHMKMSGLKYRTTSTVTEVKDDAVVEWQVGAGQKWRWEMKALGPDKTEVTETWDISEVRGFVATGMKIFGMYKRNAKGIEETLKRLQKRFS